MNNVVSKAAYDDLCKKLSDAYAIELRMKEALLCAKNQLWQSYEWLCEKGEYRRAVQNQDVYEIVRKALTPSTPALPKES